ncbi:MAG: hypothetical protein GX785_05890 [Armatimonadetes bacterium]|nr:hypothetical protein [Armatimonadota bacterium]
MTTSERLRWLRACGVGLLMALSLALRLPTLGGINFTPDAAEYAGMARRLAEGHGLTTALKWHFFDHGPVVRPAVVERPILYPLLGGLVLRLFPEAEPLRALQATNAALAAVNTALALAAFHTVVPAPVAWLAAALFVLLPPVTETATLALSEQLFLSLWLLALLLLPGVTRPRRAAAFGLVAGLATLARPNGILLFLALPWLLSPVRRHRNARRATLAALAASGAVLLPYSLYAWTARAPEMRPAALVNYAVLHIHQATWHGFGQTIPSPPAFIAGHLGAVAAAIHRKVEANLAALWVSLFPLPLLLLLRVHARPADPTRALCRAWLTLAVASFAFYSLAWVAAGALRYLLPGTILLLPLLLEHGFRVARSSPAARGLFCLTLVGAVSLFGAHWQEHQKACRYRWNRAAGLPYAQAAKWIEELAGPEDVVASNNPWEVHYQTCRPAVACPFFRDRADLTRLRRQFGVRWVLLFAYPRDARLQLCREHPNARLVRQTWNQRGWRAYLFALDGTD